jgi:hypothetical protein
LVLVAAVVVVCRTVGVLSRVMMRRHASRLLASTPSSAPLAVLLLLLVSMRLLSVLLGLLLGVGMLWVRQWVLGVGMLLLLLC